MKKALLYLFLFLFFQVLTSIFVMAAASLICYDTLNVTQTNAIILSSGLASLLTIGVFAWRKYCNFNTTYISTQPWNLLLLTALLSITLILPSAFLQEQLPESLTKDNLENVFSVLLSSFGGYIIIGLLAPVCEEVVFRGAVLRELLRSLAADGNSRRVWGCIVFSALFFSFAHMNPAQIPHAFVIGLLLGWLFYRTGSIIPGLVYHFVNNTAAFAIAFSFPELPYNAKTIELCNNDTTLLYSLLGISTLCAVMILYVIKKTIASKNK